jgi:hypothetical protein
MDTLPSCKRIHCSIGPHRIQAGDEPARRRLTRDAGSADGMRRRMRQKAKFGQVAKR